MHCVLLGCFKELLNFLWRGLSTQEKIFVSKEVQDTRAPLEVVEHGRNLRDLFHTGHFKANEFFNYLLFVSPIIFKDRLADFLYDHLLCLVFGNRILLESSSETDIELAELLLERYCSAVTDIFQTETAETINVHCLRHLAHQCRLYGPLFVFSAMAFESANRTLSESFTGTHSHCAVICRRYLEAQELASCVVENDRAAELLQEWSNLKKPSEKNFSKDVLLLPEIHRSLELFPDAQILSRSFVDGVYFDSLCYKRCSDGPNSFIKVKKDSGFFFAQIVFFIIMGEDSYSGGLKFAQVKKMVAKNNLTLQNFSNWQFFYEVEFTENEDMIEASAFEKMFFMKSHSKFYLASVPLFLDHK